MWNAGYDAPEELSNPELGSFPSRKSFNVCQTTELRQYKPEKQVTTEPTHALLRHVFLAEPHPTLKYYC